MALVIAGDPDGARPCRRATCEGRGAPVPEATAEVSAAVTSPRRLGARRAGRRSLGSGSEPFAESYHYASLDPDFAELTAQAEELVADATGLRSLAGPARARVADRAGWVRANIASFQRLLRPLTRQARASGCRAERARAVSRRRSPAPRSACCSAGCRRRVLGQYDLLVIEDENPDEQDIVYYVGPNSRPREAVRLPAPRVPAVARAARGHPPRPVHRRAVDARALPRPRRADVQLGRPRSEAVPRRARSGRRRRAHAAAEPARRRRPGRAGRHSDEQRAVLDQDRRADERCSRATATSPWTAPAPACIPSAERFSRVLRERRQQAQRVAKAAAAADRARGQAQPVRAGRAVHRGGRAVGGPALLDRAWEAPANLPTLDEIRAPDLLARSRLGLAVA